MAIALAARQQHVELAARAATADHLRARARAARRWSCPSPTPRRTTVLPCRLGARRSAAATCGCARRRRPTSRRTSAPRSPASLLVLAIRLWTRRQFPLSYPDASGRDRRARRRLSPAAQRTPTTEILWPACARAATRRSTWPTTRISSRPATTSPRLPTTPPGARPCAGGWWTSWRAASTPPSFTRIAAGGTPRSARSCRCGAPPSCAPRSGSPPSIAPHRAVLVRAREAYARAGFSTTGRPQRSSPWLLAAPGPGRGLPGRARRDLRLRRRPGQRGRRSDEGPAPPAPDPVRAAWRSTRPPGWSIGWSPASSSTGPGPRRARGAAGGATPASCAPIRPGERPGT